MVDIQNNTSSFPDQSIRMEEGQSNMISSRNRKPQNEPMETSPDELVRTETKFVQYFRTATIALLIAEAVTAGLIIYRQAVKQESQAFHKDFETVSSLIVQGFTERLDRLLWDAYTMSVAIQGIVAATGQSSPNISISIFNELALNPLVSSQIERVVWSPYVTDQQQRSEFEAYARANGSAVAFREMAPFQAEEIFVMDVNSSSTFAAPNTGPYFPVWQVAPFNNTEHAILFDLSSEPIQNQALQQMMEAKLPALSEVFNVSQSFLKLIGDTVNETNILGTALYYPVIGNSGNLLGSVSFDFIWENLIESILPQNNMSDHLLLVLENTQGQAFSFSTSGVKSTVELLGNADLHNPQYNRMAKETSYQLFDTFRQRFSAGVHNSQDLGSYRVAVYPTEVYEMAFEDNSVLSYTLAPVVFLFIFTTMMFLLYDCIVKRRQTKVMASAVASGAIVSSLFPAAVRDRLLAHAQHDQEISGEFSIDVESPKEEARHAFLPRLMETPKLRLKRFLSSNPASSGPMTIRSDEEPIADLFHNTTVLFADIAGFTAWSSEREPPQVFKLLETLYSAFDNIANSLGVFKVETIGDCYVAVTGLPEPQADHAVRMAKFASTIILKMQDLTKVLESSLGPSTANLSVRVGLHSGPVTAGVLRGQKARFQLFGDTINTASRMESTGHVNKIQVSQATAELLVQAGHPKWVTPRQELLSVKGKGDMQTYWINSSIVSPAGRTISRSHSGSEKSLAESSVETWGKLTFHDNSLLFKPTEKTRLERLIDWNTDLLFNYLSEIVVKRIADEAPRLTTLKTRRFEIKGKVSRDIELHVGSNGYPIDEITDSVTMPTTTSTTSAAIKKLIAENKDLINLASVRGQLHHYVAKIASMYRPNPFHCFEHASHVVMSACKLLKRIVTPDDIDYEKKEMKALSEDIHASTYGISSDPLLQFTVVFSALIHDVDHRGIPNAQLVNDRHEMAIKFNNKSVAEQHSIQVAWNLLMEETYVDLRASIYSSETELLRFRQLLVNSVLATDIADQSRLSIRKRRWEKVFNQSSVNDEQETEAVVSDDNNSNTDGDHDVERKASLVLEYVIQASDVAHTMQHWHVYIKWNERLFEERYLSYVEGRANQDPSLCWYQDEIWFFDSYVIPLAKKLAECGVFGVSSQEYLTYALENRREWEEKGRQWVAQMVGAQAKAA